MFQGFNTVDAISTLSLLCGFLITFTGVYLLNLSRRDPEGLNLTAQQGGNDAIGTDMVSSFQTRLSMQARRSTGSLRHSISDREGLIRAYDEEEANGFGLTDLAEESDDDGMGRANGRANGHSKRAEATEFEDSR